MVGHRCGISTCSKMRLHDAPMVLPRPSMHCQRFAAGANDRDDLSRPSSTPTHGHPPPVVDPEENLGAKKAELRSAATVAHLGCSF